MEAERICGTCVFGADANDRFGNIDPNYVICQIKASEIKERKPHRFHTTSAVTRMHYYREACLHWRADMAKFPGEQPLPMSTPMHPPEPVLDYDQQAPAVEKVNHEPLSEEQKNLKLKLIQQEQMVLSLQNQVGFLSEQVQALQTELSQKDQKLKQLSPFDPAIFSEVNYFALLGVNEKASDAEIKEAYRQRMKHLHPDRFINIAQRLNVAYETLTHPERKRQYLQSLQSP